MGLWGYMKFTKCMRVHVAALAICPQHAEFPLDCCKTIFITQSVTCIQCFQVSKATWHVHDILIVKMLVGLKGCQNMHALYWSQMTPYIQITSAEHTYYIGCCYPVCCCCGMTKWKKIDLENMSRYCSKGMSSCLWMNQTNDSARDCNFMPCCSCSEK